MINERLVDLNTRLNALPPHTPFKVVEETVQTWYEIATRGLDVNQAIELLLGAIKRSACYENQNRTK